MIKVLKAIVCLLVLFSWNLSFSQVSDDSIADNRPKNEHFFEAYVYLISQDALQSKDAFSVANSLNIIGDFVLLGRNKSNSTHLDYWVYTTEPSNPEESVPELANNAGLLWNTNDLGTNVFLSGIGVLAFRQNLLNDRLLIKAGKLFPGVHYQSNYYAPNNSEVHMNNMLSGGPTSSWFGLLGLGLMAEYTDDYWFGKAGIHDASAVKEIDFESLSDGAFMYIFEAGIKANNSLDRRVSLLYSYVDDKPDKSPENAWSLGGVYEFGEQGFWSLYGRYTLREGGLGKTEEVRIEDNKVIHGGFLGTTKKSPFHWKKAEIGLAWFIGVPTDYQVSIGSNTQTGIETYFRWNFKKLIQAAFDFQLIHTGVHLEPIIGARFKVGWNTLF